MSGAGVDLRRRRFLTAATTVVGGVGAGLAAVPFVASMQPSEKAKASGAPILVDISTLEPGQRVVRKHITSLELVESGILSPVRI